MGVKFALSPFKNRVITLFVIVLLTLDNGALAGEVKSVSGGHSQSSSQAQRLCLKVFGKYFSDQRSHGYFVESGEKKCKGRIANPSHFQTAPELLNQLEKDPQYSLGRLNTQELRRCTSDNSHQLVAQYYYTVNRVETAALTNLEEIAAIDTIVRGQSKLSGVNCATGRSDKILKRCEQIKSCSKQEPNIDTLTAETVQAEKNIREFDRLIADTLNITGLTKKKITLIDGTQVELTSQELAKLRSELMAARDPLAAKYKSRYPWIAGTIYKRQRPKDDHPERVKQAILQQLEENRGLLVKDMATYQSHINCLTNSNFADGTCDLDTLRNTLRNTPELEQHTVVKSSKWSARDAAVADEYIEYAKCVDEAAQDAKKADTTAVSLAGDVVLTFATAGLAPIALGAKVLSTSRKLNLAARAGAGATIGGASGVVAAPQVVAMYESCREQESQLQVVAAAKQSDADFCPSTTSPLNKAAKDYEGCLESAQLMSLDVLSIGAGRVLSKLPGRQPGQIDFGEKGGVHSRHKDAIADEMSALYASRNAQRVYHEAKLNLTRIEVKSLQKGNYTNDKASSQFGLGDFSKEGRVTIDIVKLNDQKVFIKSIERVNADEAAKYEALKKLGFNTPYIGVTEIDGKKYIVSKFIDGPLLKPNYNPVGVLTVGPTRDRVVHQLLDFERKFHQLGILPDDVQFILDRSGNIHLIDPAEYEFGAAMTKIKYEPNPANRLHLLSDEASYRRVTFPIRSIIDNLTGTQNPIP
jgi:hypothetical protein